MSSPWNSAEIIELPVFRPNEFMIEKAKQKGMKPEVYFMESVRAEMGYALGVPLSDEKVEQKLQYKDEMKLFYKQKSKKD